MNIRIYLTNFFLRLSRFLANFPVLILKPDQIIKYHKINYNRKDIIELWSSLKVLDLGLSSQEKKAISDIPIKKGSLLVLGVGGGREAIPLAKMGFEITGVDFVDKLVRNAEENAKKAGVEIRGKVLDISNLCLENNFYEIAWMSSSLYSCIPSRKKRIQVLRILKKALKPDGYLFCEFQFDFNKTYSNLIEKLKKIIALLCFGNRHYEKGDLLYSNFEFIHRFTSQDSLTREFEESGFDIISLDFPKNDIKGHALLKTA